MKKSELKNLIKECLKEVTTDSNGTIDKILNQIKYDLNDGKYQLEYDDLPFDKFVYRRIIDLGGEDVPGIYGKIMSRLTYQDRQKYAKNSRSNSYGHRPTSLARKISGGRVGYG